MSKKKKNKLSKLDRIMDEKGNYFLSLIIPVSYCWSYLFYKNLELDSMWLVFINVLWLVVFAFMYTIFAFGQFIEDD